MGTEKLDGLRPRRRMSRPSQLPSAAYYVGYVEEGETPQMIMKKFEELEKVRTGSTIVKGAGMCHAQCSGKIAWDEEKRNAVLQEMQFSSLQSFIQHIVLSRSRVKFLRIHQGIKLLTPWMLPCLALMTPWENACNQIALPFQKPSCCR